MLPPADPVRLSLPAPAPPPARGGFPIVATLAPVAMSLAVWAITQSVLSLLFAGLGPIVALAGLVDGRIRRRRQQRVERERLAAAFARLRERIAGAHDAERARRAALVAPRGDGFARWAVERWVRDADPARPLAVRVGLGAVSSPVHLDGGDVDGSPGPAWIEARAAASIVDGAVVLADGTDGIGIVGPLPLARAAARAVLVQLAAMVPPDASVTAPASEEWVAALPHAVALDDGARFIVRDGDRELVVAWARDDAGLPPGCAARVRLDDGGRVPALSRVEAQSQARRLAGAASRHGLGAAATAPPDRVALGELLAAQEPSRPRSLAAPIGRDARDPVIVDLVADGPHALVGGTTGSGKSELLVSWVLAMAHGRTPAEVTFLLVDFKGGAAFAPLAGMPHVVGILSDLDARLTRRAIESLRAELLRRERLLADAGARSIDELPAAVLARLVVVVDEFAAVVAGQPELHEVFGDLAARGRSLGLHLVLCTQRPAGVVRDGVLANVTLRIGLRMTDRGDSIALLGDEGAARLPADPRGRAVLALDGGTRAFQVAIAGAVELGATRRDSAGAAARPWLDPLPVPLPITTIGTATAETIPLGRADLPAEQRQPVAAHRPAEHGHLLVIGAAGAGRTTALGVLARAPGAVVLPLEPADAWQVLDGLLRGREQPTRRLLVTDDLDLLLGRTDPDARHDLVELLGRVLREGPARGIGVVVSAQRPAGSLQPLVGLFGSRLLLRMPSREEHVLAGGAGAEFDPALPSGAGRWRGVVVQVAWPGSNTLPAAEPPPLPDAAPEPGRPLAIIAARPSALGDRLREAGWRVAMVGDPVDPAHPGALDPAATDVLLGDPDAWQADWTLLGRARRELRFAVVGCTAAELRALTRARDAVPPLGARPGECWLVDAGTVRRARLRLDR